MLTEERKNHELDFLLWETEKEEEEALQREQVAFILVNDCLPTDVDLTISIVLAL